MDLNNNEVGYSIGENAVANDWDDTRIQEEIVAAIEDGRFVTL